MSGRRALTKASRRRDATHSYAFDLYQKLPYHALSTADCAKYWDDGLHLTEAGYAWMGGHIADALLALLLGEPSGPRAAAAAPAPAAAHDDDDDDDDDDYQVVLDDEVGDPKAADQGYVMVRKRDLS